MTTVDTSVPTLAQATGVPPTTPSSPAAPNYDDPNIATQAANMTKAIFQHESGNDYKAVGDNGTSNGAGQWQAATWKAQAGDVLGDPNAPMTPENQSIVAQGTIRKLIAQGKNAAQIAAIWNHGSDEGWENLVGTKNINGKQISYNVPKYVKAVTDLYQQYKNGSGPSADTSTAAPTDSGAPSIADQRAALEAAGQPVSVNPNKAAPSFFGSLIRNIISPVVRGVNTVVEPVQKLVTGNDNPNEYNPYLGDVSGLGMKQGQTTGQRVKDVVGGLANIAADFVGGEGATGVAEAGLEGLAKQGLITGAKEGAITGALGGFGGALQSDKAIPQVIASTALGGAGGALTGGALGGITGAAGKVPEALFGKEAGTVANSEIDKSIAQTLGSGGKKTGTALARNIEQNREGFTSLFNRGQGVEVTNLDGEKIPFNPQKATLAETIQAHTQVKNNIYNEYTKIAQESGDQGALVDVKPIIDNLRSITTEVGRRSTAVDKAANIADDLERNFPQGRATPAQIQSFVEDLNQETAASFRSGNFNAKSDVAANAAQQLRQAADDTIRHSTGKQYQALRNEYGALKSIEAGIVKRFQQQTRRVSNGIPGYVDIAGNIDLLSSILKSNPGTFVKGSALKLIANALKNSRDPENMLQNTFSLIAKNQEGTPGIVGALKNKYASVFGAAPDTIQAPVQPNEVKIPNQSSELIITPPPIPKVQKAQDIISPFGTKGVKPPIPNTGKIIPTDSWQEIPKGAVVPPGGTYKIDMQNGKTYARWKK